MHLGLKRTFPSPQLADGQRTMLALRSFILIVLMCAACFSSVSCQAVALVLYKLSPPPKVPAKYVPKKEPMLVLVENYENPSVTYVASQQLNAALRADLERNKVAPLVDADKIVELRDLNPEAFKKMSIPQLGKSVGAKQVLYINLQSLNVEGDGVMARGMAQGQVKIIDVATGQTLWPTDLVAGYELLLQTPHVRIDERTNEQTVRNQLVTSVSDQVSKLFYKWTVQEGIQ